MKKAADSPKEDLRKGRAFASVLILPSKILGMCLLFKGPAMVGLAFDRRTRFYSVETIVQFGPTSADILQTGRFESGL